MNAIAAILFAAAAVPAAPHEQAVRHATGSAQAVVKIIQAERITLSPRGDSLHRQVRQVLGIPTVDFE